MEQRDRKLEEDARKDVHGFCHVFLRRVGTTLVSVRKLISDSVETGSLFTMTHYSMTHSSHSAKRLCLHTKVPTVGNEIVCFGFARHSRSFVARVQSNLIFHAETFVQNLENDLLG